MSVTRVKQIGVRPFSLLPKGIFSLETYKFIKQPPGYIVGTVNDAYVSPTPDYFHGGYHWTYDRIVGICMVPLTIVPFAANVDLPMLDSLFASLLLIHCHAGFKSCIIDYIPARKFGIWYKFASWLLTFGSAVGLYGVYEIETEGTGLYELIRSTWNALGRAPE